MTPKAVSQSLPRLGSAQASPAEQDRSQQRPAQPHAQHSSWSPTAVRKKVDDSSCALKKTSRPIHSGVHICWLSGRCDRSTASRLPSRITTSAAAASCCPLPPGDVGGSCGPGNSGAGEAMSEAGGTSSSGAHSASASRFALRHGKPCMLVSAKSECPEWSSLPQLLRLLALRRRREPGPVRSSGQVKALTGQMTLATSTSATSPV
mmetsp:Transcript_88130/g.234345  ORF Transcript_88130/g.234345 Transcript_88130/m.234345 type:complete len:206 (+) Transcript_88130:483-1100(+)